MATGNIEPVEGALLGECVNGAAYLRMHYTIDPSKRDPEWIAQTRTAIGELDWLRQMEMSEDVFEGQPVFAAWNQAIHLPVHFRTHKIPIVPGSDIIVGWDCGTASVHPAAAVVQVTPKTKDVGRIVCALMEIIAEPGTSMELFTPAVCDTIRAQYPDLPLHLAMHCGDETGRNRQGATESSAFDVMLRHGVNCRPITNNWSQRSSAIDRLLKERVSERMPRFTVCGHLCPVLSKGFNGGYRLRQVITSQGTSTYREPVKDEYSHVQDALQYAAILAWQLIDGGGIEVRRRDGRRTSR